MNAKKFAERLFGSLPKEQWTTCYAFRCVMNTGWAAREDRYKCRIGYDCKNAVC